MTKTELAKFLLKEQQQSVDAQELEALIEKFEPSTAKKEGLLTQCGQASCLFNSVDSIIGVLSVGFNGLMASFSIWKKEHRCIFQDMDQPLTSYYIASSHNTYVFVLL